MWMESDVSNIQTRYNVNIEIIIPIIINCRSQNIFVNGTKWHITVCYFAMYMQK